MLLEEYHIPKSIKHTVLKFENFTLVNGRIFNNKQIALPAGGWKDVKFDDLPNVLKRALRYSNHNLKELQKCSTFTKHRWRDEYETNDKHWTEKLATEEFLPETQMSLLNEFDRDPSVLSACIHYDHSLWDWNMKRVSVPIRLEYIGARLDNEKYKLKSLLEHLNKMNRDKLIDISYSKEVMAIPHYNCSETRNKCLVLDVVFKQEIYEELANATRDKKSSEEKRDYPSEYYSVDSDRMRAQVARALGFEAFEKPEKKDEDD